VSLVAILDADREGFLRSGTSLIQTIGERTRNVNAEVICTPDHVDGFDKLGDGRDLSSATVCKASTTPRTASRRGPLRARIESCMEDEVAAHELAADAAGVTKMTTSPKRYMESCKRRCSLRQRTWSLSEPRPCGTRSTN